ncbi:MAG: hypothetical protein UH963_00920 [Agathobacter sp.]|nr:hypothetical protein [Agathobacter sp.]
MLKIVGSLIILCSMAGMICSWVEMKNKKRKYIWGIYQIMCKGEYAILKEKKKTADFFNGVSGIDEELEKMCKKVAENLYTHKFKSGEEAWVDIFGKKDKEFKMTKDEKDLINQIGGVFFARSSMEMKKLFGVYEEQILQLFKAEKNSYRESKKVVMALGMLGSVMVIILLI